MKFSLSCTKDCSIGKPTYICEEESFYFDPYIQSDFTLMLGCSYLGLNISTESKCIINLSGLCPKHLWQPQKLSPPEDIVKGSAVVEGNEVLISGTGKDLLEQSFVFYDQESNWCCIKTIDDVRPDLNIEFATNCILSLSKGNFIALWVKPIFE